ncbi:MAG: patatin family protein [Oscillospiraceae bacterium]|nr:patatin family protein [Oscillospiraceae bacterium]
MIGLIDVGGGMRGIYGAGILDCFLDNNIEPDYCIGVSAGSANVASFLAKQKGRNYRFYTVHAADKRYMSLGNYIKTRSYFDFDYIYGTLTNEVDRIDYGTLLASETKAVIVATEAETGESAYFTKNDFKPDDCRILMASCAIPPACLPVDVNGIKYFDGGVSDPVPVKKAIDDGCNRLIVILTKPFGHIMRPERFPFVYKRLLKNYPKAAGALEKRDKTYMASIKTLKEMEYEGSAVVLAPEKPLELKIASKNTGKLSAVYNQGYSDAEKKLDAVRKLW